ncbi:MAG TPA: hypothetical protein PKI99_02000 [Terrimesophilobacter sp.]|nr:hypothetical protein [Terrimesophilobacter sp.]
MIDAIFPKLRIKRRPIERSQIQCYGRCRVCDGETSAWGETAPLLCFRCVYSIPRQRWPEWSMGGDKLPSIFAYHPRGGSALSEARAAIMHFDREIKKHGR